MNDRGQFYAGIILVGIAVYFADLFPIVRVALAIFGLIAVASGHP